jgi:integrase
MAYGSGSIYPRGKIWWISYMLDGEQQNESSKSEERKDAAALLRKRMGELSVGRALGTGRALTISDLLARLEESYVEAERRSIADLKGKIKFLKQAFKGMRASEFGTDDIKRFKRTMKKNDAANATVNRYLATLRRAFNLAEQNDPPLVGRVPHFEMLPEDNVREGFLTDSQYGELKQWLPDHVKGLLIFGYHLGMRKEALKTLRRDQVDWPAKVIRVEQVRGGKKVGRVIPIYGDMIPWLEMQMPRWPFTPKCRWVLHHNGARIGDFRKSWATACRAAKVPGLLFHDLRRSAVRNLERAGVPRSQAKAITGHKTDSVYDRYAIVSEADVRTVGEKLTRLMEEVRTPERNSETGERKQ